MKGFFTTDSLGPMHVRSTEGKHVPLHWKRMLNKRQRYVTLSLLFLLTIVSIGLFTLSISKTTLFTGYATPIDRLFAFLLMISEMYVLIQTLGYYLQVYQSVKTPNVARTNRLAIHDVPPVAIYIATYNEPAEVIEETVVAVSLLNYAEKQIYINCDHQSTQQAEIVRQIAERQHVNFIHRVPNTGYKAGGINEFIFRLGHDLPHATMLCIFDADSVPAPTYLSEVVPLFADDPRLAFVQAPQHYSNQASSLIAETATVQQSLFGEFISEGKQQSEAMFYTGTNVVFRLDALLDIGGLIIDSVTEDFATSLKLHARGWRSQYSNMAYVNGIAPTTLHAYWTQQHRWALGNIESFFASFKDIFFIPGFTFLQRWEYFVSGSYFFCGLNNIIAMICPVMFLLFGVRPLVIDPRFYLLAYLPHVLVSNWFFFLTMGHRGYNSRTLFLSQCMVFMTFPIYASAAIDAILHIKRPFAVTPKGAGQMLPWIQLKWQISTFVLLVIATLVGCAHLFGGSSPIVIINIIWCVYHSVMLSTLVIFNRPEKMLTHPALIPMEVIEEVENESHAILPFNPQYEQQAA